MKKLKNKNDLAKAFKNESLMMHDAIDSKKYGDLEFQCGCGEMHSLNDSFYAAKTLTAKPNKFLYMCKNSPALTFVEVEGKKTNSLWITRIELFQEHASSVLKSHKSYKNIKKIFE